MFGKCDHGELENHDDNWLEPDSPAHEALKKVTMDHKFLHDVVPYLVNFR